MCQNILFTLVKKKFCRPAKDLIELSPHLQLQFFETPSLLFMF